MDKGAPQQPDSISGDKTELPSANLIPGDPSSIIISSATSSGRTQKPQPKPGLKKVIFLVVGLVFIAGTALLIDHFDSTSSRKQHVVSVKVYKVGILDGLEPKFGAAVSGFEQGMSKLGYVKGKNITYDVKNEALNGNQAILKGFVRERDNMIVVLPTEPTQEAEAVLKGITIPIVSLGSSFEGTNLIESIQHPGHNLTGVRYPGPEDSVEALKVLHQLAPNDTRILVPYLAGYPNVPAQLTALQAEAKILDLTIIPKPLSPNGISPYVTGLSSTDPGFDAITTMAEPFAGTATLNEQLYNFADQHHIPIMGNFLNNNNTGPIAFVGPTSNSFGELAAPLANKIFKGDQSGTLPVLTPVSYLRVNLKVARRLGITPDAGLLSTATQIIR